MKRIFLFILIIFIVISSFLFYYRFLKQEAPQPIPPPNLSEDFPIRFYSWKKPEPLYSLIPLTASSGEELESPNSVYVARLKENEIEVISHDRNKKIESIPLSNDITDFQYLWLNDQLLILIEKEDTEQAVDIFYVIDIHKGEKQFFTGSFVIPSRINLEKEIKKYEDGHVLIIEDNEGGLWQLDLLF